MMHQPGDPHQWTLSCARPRMTQNHHALARQPEVPAIQRKRPSRRRCVCVQGHTHIFGRAVRAETRVSCCINQPANQEACLPASPPFEDDPVP
eukprot:1159079-Pelagomonas_calceolata.AAC.3